MKIIIFYGSFDPPHLGHLKITKEALKQLKGDMVYFGLNKNSPIKKISSFNKRKEMLKLAIKGNSKFHYLDIPFNYNDISSTYDRIFSFCKDNNEYYILVGQDQLENISGWYNYELLKTKFKFVVASRNYTPINKEKNYIYLDNKYFNITSSKIKEGRYACLNKQVKEYIVKNNVYLIKQVKEYIPTNKYKHSLMVKKVALEIYKNNKEGLIKNKIITASLLHDIAKYYPYSKQKMIIKKYYPDKIKENPSTYHQYVGEYIAKKKFHICDEEILEAIKYHTSANKNMSKLAKLIYCADKIEPTREYDSKYLIDECITDLENGFKLVIGENIKYLRSKGIKVDNKETIDAINQYLK